MKVLGCGKIITPYRTCGDVSFANKIISCHNCRRRIEQQIKEAIRKKWEAEREHCDNCEPRNYCATCKPNFEKLNEIIKIREVLEPVQ